MLKTGTLNQRIDVYLQTITNSDSGDPVASWGTARFTSRAAAVEPVSSAESEQGNGTVSRTAYKVTIWFDESIKHTDRIVWRSQNLNIVSVLHDYNQRTTTILTSIEG